MEKINKIYYINLDRRPDRNEHFLNQCAKHSLPSSKIQRVQAVDGLTFRFNDEMYNMFANSDFTITLKKYRELGLDNESYKVAENIVKKLMGNQLSHYTILNNIIDNDYEYSIIFQDDARFNNNIVEYIDNLLKYIPEDGELINIGLNKFADGSMAIPWDFVKDTDTDISKEFINEHICKLKEDVNPCSLAYIVTKKGARNLVNHFSKVGFLQETDHNFNQYLITKDTFYCCRNIMATSENFGSDIFSKEVLFE
uniref:Glycosyl transferase family 25 domain-containing protein n=1 Tax=viral metagenome TaxID=1070528 RepID=A0A6C0JQF8_9ZZZZ